MKSKCGPRLNAHSVQGERAILIYQHLGEGPFTLEDIKQVLDKKCVSGIVCALRENKILCSDKCGFRVVPQHRAPGVTTTQWMFSPEAAKKIRKYLE